MFEGEDGAPGAAPTLAPEPTTTPDSGGAGLLDNPIDPGTSAPEPNTAPQGDPEPLINNPAPETWIPNGYQDNPNVNKYNSLEDMLNGHASLVKKLGEKGIIKPGEGSSEEEWNAFYTNIGRPNSPEEYIDWKSQTKVDGNGQELPAFEVDPDQYNSFREKAFALGLNQEQMKGVMDHYADITMSGQDQFIQSMETEAKETESELRREFGEKYEAEMRTIRATAEALEITPELKSLGLGNNLTILKMIHKLSTKIGESNITGDVSPHAGGFDARLKAIQEHPGFHDKSHPEYRNLQRARIDLYKNKFN